MSKDRFFGKGLSRFFPVFLLLSQLELPAAAPVSVVRAADAGANGAEKEGYELIWQDEFDGAASPEPPSGPTRLPASPPPS